MRLTDIAKADERYRQYHKAETLITSIDRRLEYYHRKMPTRLTAGILDQAAYHKAVLRDFLENGHRGGINTSLSSREILKQNVSTIMSTIFTGMPTPNKAQLNDLENTIVEMMNGAGRTQRAKQHKQLLTYEIAYRTKHDYFLIFDTLTVAPGEYNRVFSKENRTFENYIRRVKRILAKLPNETTPTDIQGHDHTYFAVIEEGSQHGRLHIHVLHFARKLPDNAMDPNRGRLTPIRREIDAFKKLWPHGYNAPIAVRYSPRDAYGNKNWRWPHDTRTGKSLQIRSPLTIANYMAKYITKSYTSNKRTKILWRVRKSQLLGKALLRELLSTLTPTQLLTVASCDSLNPKLNNETIPPAILRLTALQMYREDQSTTTQLPSLTDIGKNTEPRPSPLQLSRGSNRPSMDSNQQNTGNSLTTTILNEDEFNSAWTALRKATQRIEDKYIRQTTVTYGTTSTEDHIY